jgi:general secretion pathway protein D
MKNRTYYRLLLCVVAGVMLTASAHSAYAQDAATKEVLLDRLIGEEISGPPTVTETSVEADTALEEGLRFNFQGVPLDTVLDYLSKEAGFVIIRETEVTGRVDVRSHQPVSKDEAVDLLNTILHHKGYAAIRNGRTLTIVSRDDAKTRDIPVRKGNEPAQIPKSDEMVTHIIPVRYADAVQLVENITPLLPSYATMTANQSSNAIVLTDTQTSIRRVAEIVKALDTSISEVSTVKVFTLKDADATEIATLINTLFQTDGTGGSSDAERRRRMREFFSGMRGRGGPRDR